MCQIHVKSTTFTNKYFSSTGNMQFNYRYTKLCSFFHTFCFLSIL